MAKEQHLDLIIVVNGQPLPLEVNLNEPLQAVVNEALARTGNSGQPAQNWELRDAAGRILDLTRRVGEFQFQEQTRLFLSLKAGVGGCSDASTID